MPRISDRLDKVNESLTIYRYDNGYMIEVGGKDVGNDWKTVKILCNELEELLNLISEYATLELDN